MSGEATDEMRRALMDLGDVAVQPMREWLAGQRAYFAAQGYTDDEARAMAAATYVTVMGSMIKRTGDES